MTQFSDAFRQNVTITGALSAMLFSEDQSGQSELATKLQIAIENMHHDMIMLSTCHSGFSSNSTEGDALNELLQLAHGRLRSDAALLPDESILQVLDKHQERLYPTQNDAKARIGVVNQAFALAREITQRWQVG